MTVVTVGGCLKVASTWSVMFILTLVQSRTHVDTVQTVLDNSTIWRHICWSHTMKVLGSRVTFVRTSSARVVILRYICCVMKMWSRMFAVIVQSVSVQQLKWDVISWDTRTTNSSAVVCVVKISNVKNLLCVTSRNVLLDWDLLAWLPIEMSKLLWEEREREQSICSFMLTDTSLVEVLQSTQDVTFYVLFFFGLRHHSWHDILMMIMMTIVDLL